MYVCLCFARCFCQIPAQLYVQCQICVEALHSNLWALEDEKAVKFNFDLQKQISHFHFLIVTLVRFIVQPCCHCVSCSCHRKCNLILQRSTAVWNTCVYSKIDFFFFLPSVWHKFWKFTDLPLRSGTYQLSCCWEVFCGQLLCVSYFSSSNGHHLIFLPCSSFWMVDVVWSSSLNLIPLNSEPVKT